MDEPLYAVWFRAPGMTGWSNIARDLDPDEAEVYRSTLRVGDCNIEPQEESNG